MRSNIAFPTGKIYCYLTRKKTSLPIMLNKEIKKKMCENVFFGPFCNLMSMTRSNLFTRPPQQSRSKIDWQAILSRGQLFRLSKTQTSKRIMYFVSSQADCKNSTPYHSYYKLYLVHTAHAQRQATSMMSSIPIQINSSQIKLALPVPWR